MKGDLIDSVMILVSSPINLRDPSPSLSVKEVTSHECYLQKN